ncbi:MAG TPA: hypothetical protein DEA08_05700 [Planctomycetes bacterium]|nr:hypothetical protein [Planctomycetota bacterium]
MTDIAAFADADDLFALQFQRSDLPGLISKKLTVPAGSLALVYAEGDEIKVLAAGEECTDMTKGMLVKQGIELDVELESGRSSDGLPVTVKLQLALATRDKALDLGQLEQSFLRDGKATREEVRTLFLPYLQDALRFFVGERAAQDLVEKDQRSALDGHLGKQLEKPCFETGLQLTEVRHPRFRSESYDERRAADEEASAEAQRLQREEELAEMRKQLDRKALLADLELKDEANRTRKEQRLARYEELRSKMGDDDRKALIMMLDDDAKRAELIRELIEQDMTPEQRSQLKVSEMESAIEERLKEMQAKLANLTGSVALSRENDSVTRRVLCVVGKRVLAFDPKTNLHPEVPKEVYDTDEGGLGYLRSVRVETIDGEDYVLCGAQRGIYKVHGSQRVEFPFPHEPSGKGGANAVCYFDGHIYATHSEVGLVEWPAAGGPGRVLCGDALDGAGSVRGAQVVKGMLYFSAGNEVLSLDLATGNETPLRYRGSDDSITSFTVYRDEVVAGNRSGKLYRWKLSDPNSPESFGVMKKNPIFMLRNTEIAGQPYFVIGSKDFTVTACEPKKDLYRDYQAREEVRWVDAAGDFVFGVSRSGYKVFCWDPLRQSEPKLTIRVSDKVQDLFVLRES